VQIPVDKIRDLIGPGGKMIRSIVEQTGVKIDVEDSGLVKVASSNQESAAKALQIIGDLTATAEVGKTYLGRSRDWRTSVRSSKLFLAPMGCCTSAKWRSIALRMSATS